MITVITHNNSQRWPNHLPPHCLLTKLCQRGLTSMLHSPSCWLWQHVHAVAWCAARACTPVQEPGHVCGSCHSSEPASPGSRAPALILHGRSRGHDQRITKLWRFYHGYIVNRYNQHSAHELGGLEATRVTEHSAAPQAGVSGTGTPSPGITFPQGSWVLAKYRGARVSTNSLNRHQQSHTVLTIHWCEYIPLMPAVVSLDGPIWKRSRKHVLCAIHHRLKRMAVGVSRPRFMMSYF